MNVMRIQQTLMVAALLAPCGCLMSVSATSTERGTLVPESTTAGITRGQTTRDELVQRLGPPDRIESLADGSERLVYEAVRKESAHVGFFLLMSVNSQKEHVRTTTFEVRDGVVVDIAREQSTIKE